MLPELRGRLPAHGKRRCHVLVSEAGELYGVLPWSRIDRMVRLGESGADLPGRLVTHWIVVAQSDVVLDVVGRMRAADTDVALVTGDGELAGPDSVLGILSWGDIVRLSNLPAHLVINRVNDQTGQA